MSKLWIILLISLVLVSCTHTPHFAYEIQRPVAKPGDIQKWCWQSMQEGEEFVQVAPDESCPPESMLFSVEMEIAFFRALDHYISELEIRNEVCNTGSTDKPESYPDSDLP